ncbi:MAG: LrgB family protein [Eubacteriales bacterium]|nr:LrgB family protein [Eubacteriales bacterium]
MTEFLQSSSAWGCALTLLAFAVGTFIHKKTKQAWCNPLLIGSLLVICTLGALRIPYAQYKASAQPISYLLLPATVSLAVPLYESWEILRKNAPAIFAGIAAGTLTSLGSITLMAWLLHLSPAQYATLLPKSVTTAIGMDVAGLLGGMAPLAGAVIILTGIAGNLLAVWVCRVFRITSPMARGVGVGTASHAIGTAKAMEMGKTEGAMSSLSIAVAGVLTALLAPLFAGFVG